MILSVSRRTDIPSFYGEWFLNRLKEEYVLVKNHFDSNRYSKVILNKDTIDIIVFWTKNVKPFLSYLPKIDEMGYKYYFQYTITPYLNDIEQFVPEKEEMIKTFIELSKKIGKDKVVWRYDPILINEKYDLNFHLKSFRHMASLLSKYTNRCVISFVDNYKSISERLGYNVDYQMTLSNVEKIINIFSLIASEYNLKLYTCSENFDLSKYGVMHGSCIDKEIIENILGKKIKVNFDKKQRKDCLCLESIDIGQYNSCLNDCSYCYAKHENKEILKHDPSSSVLLGNIDEHSIITERKTITIIDNQLTLF